VSEAEQMQLFDIKPAPVKKRTVSGDQAIWQKYNQRSAVRPHQCDFCLLNCHADRTAPIPRKARYVRKAAEQVWYLCLAHANDQRVADGLVAFRGSP
jgi:hypothetical protein